MILLVFSIFYFGFIADHFHFLFLYRRDVPLHSLLFLCFLYFLPFRYIHSPFSLFPAIFFILLFLSQTDKRSFFTYFFFRAIPPFFFNRFFHRIITISPFSLASPFVFVKTDLSVGYNPFLFQMFQSETFPNSTFIRLSRCLFFCVIVLSRRDIANNFIHRLKIQSPILHKIQRVSDNYFQLIFLSVMLFFSFNLNYNIKIMILLYHPTF